MLTAKVTTYAAGSPSRVERTTYGYDASGIRVSALLEIDSTADGTYETRTKTEYLNDPRDESGYSQVLAETTTDAATSQIQKRVVYTLGHDRISQTTVTYSSGAPQTPETLTFGQDGHGSTRVLFDLAGSLAVVSGVRQVFHYDAFGNPIAFDSTLAATAFLYSGEQTDSTGLQYLRARYYDPNTGRFNRLDPFAGKLDDPLSLHKYLFTPADPVNFADPTGMFFSILLGAAIDTNLQSMSINGYNAAFETAQTQLEAMDSYYNLKVLQALNMDRRPSPWVVMTMTALPVLGWIASEGGPRINVSKLMNMSPADWKTYIKDTFGYLPDSHQAGRVAEVIAKAWLKLQGYTDIIAIQNASGHGVDLVAKHASTGRWVAFEIKGHVKEGAARLGKLQKLGAKGFAEDVLRRIDEGGHGWNNISKETRAAAEAVRTYIKSNTLHGVVINVENALDAVSVVIKTKLWRVFVRR